MNIGFVSQLPYTSGYLRNPPKIASKFLNFLKTAPHYEMVRSTRIKFSSKAPNDSDKQIRTDLPPRDIWRQNAPFTERLLNRRRTLNAVEEYEMRAKVYSFKRHEKNFSPETRKLKFFPSCLARNPVKRARFVSNTSKRSFFS